MTDKSEVSVALVKSMWSVQESLFWVAMAVVGMLSFSLTVMRKNDMWGGLILTLGAVFWVDIFRRHVQKKDMFVG